MNIKKNQFRGMKLELFFHEIQTEMAQHLNMKRLMCHYWHVWLWLCVIGQLLIFVKVTYCSQYIQKRRKVIHLQLVGSTFIEDASFNHLSSLPNKLLSGTLVSVFML